MKAITPIRFGTDGWRAVIALDFTFDNLSRVAFATAQWLKEQAEKPTLILGYDCRFNGQEFAEFVATLMVEQGVKVLISPGFVSTPMVALATLQRQATAGVIITASHNPPKYSGYKVKGAFGGPAFPAMIAAIEQKTPNEPCAVQGSFEQYLAAKQIEYYDMEALYINYLRQNFDLERIRQAQLKLGYDAMFGAGQKVMRRILPETICLHCDYNPSFLGQAPEPIERNLKEFQAVMLQNQLHWGLATDGDADRIGLFDEKAQFVDSHHILLLLIYYLHEIKNLTGKVVVTFSVTEKVKILCQQYGLPLTITPIGFKYVGEIIAQETVLVGGEESGGIAVWGHIPERDGIYIGLMILELMAVTGKTLTELKEVIYSKVGRFAVQRYDLHLQESQKAQIIENCKNNRYTKFGNYLIQRIETIDGYKFYLPENQWVMIRPSGTEPVLRIYAEAQDKAAAYRILDQTKAAILS